MAPTPNPSTEGRGGGESERQPVYLPPVIDSFGPILHRREGPFHVVSQTSTIQKYDCSCSGLVQETGGERRDKGVGKQDIHSNVPLPRLLLFSTAANAAADADK